MLLDKEAKHAKTRLQIYNLCTEKGMTWVRVTIGPMPKDIKKVPHKGANSKGQINRRLTKPENKDKNFR